MSEILTKQETLFYSVSRALENFKKLGKNNYTGAKIRSRITALKDIWIKCVQTHADLLRIVPEEKRDDIKYFKDHHFDNHEDKYNETLDYMADCLEEIEPHNQSIDQGHQSSPVISSLSLSHLPPIKIPPFSVIDTHPVLTTTASILNSLTSYSPSSVLSHVNWPHLAGLNLADPDPLSKDPIDIIIGADLYSELLLDGIRKGSPGQPIAQQTILGWVLSGPTSISTTAPRTFTAQHCSGTLSLDQALCKFWELEEIPFKTPLSPDEQQCEEHFLATHARRSDGRYVVNIPFKKGPPIDIGDSRQIAERCLKALHCRFQVNPELKTKYANFITEYEALGHMRKSENLTDLSQCVYIPHHPRILWNENPTEPPHEYQLLTVTYGTASAPFLALRVLKQLVTDEGESFPLAVPVLQNNTYVDDVLFGADDIPLLRQTRDQVRALLQRGGFELRKWSSNFSARLAIKFAPCCNAADLSYENGRVIHLSSS
ncbi:hypothetical protein RF55_13124 [Lasius niger]|uniref:Peptidase aspartic putative domain-containing protein n=1 Tax=Lasius niger TaxID=67767 RepID=A0A0J7KB10_LASNI|nr:hypothetical protein RF55_13124 [Lasius niger]